MVRTQRTTILVFRFWAKRNAIFPRQVWEPFTWLVITIEAYAVYYSVQDVTSFVFFSRRVVYVRIAPIRWPPYAVPTLGLWNVETRRTCRLPPNGYLPACSERVSASTTRGPLLMCSATTPPWPAMDEKKKSGGTTVYPTTRRGSAKYKKKSVLKFTLRQHNTNQHFSQQKKTFCSYLQGVFPQNIISSFIYYVAFPLLGTW